jgi:hypothetical protein
MDTPGFVSWGIIIYNGELMTTASEPGSCTFTTTFPVAVYIRPQRQPGEDIQYSSAIEWQEYDHGPGVINVPDGMEINIRIQRINDDGLRLLVEELADCTALCFLNLSENRNITDAGMVHLRLLPQLTGLNLSSCDLTRDGLVPLAGLAHLYHLDLSYCNRLSDTAVPALRALNHLTFLDLKGVLKLKSAGLARLRRRHLTIHN